MVKGSEMFSSRLFVESFLIFDSSEPDFWVEVLLVEGVLLSAFDDLIEPCLRLSWSCFFAIMMIFSKNY